MQPVDRNSKIKANTSLLLQKVMPKFNVSHILKERQIKTASVLKVRVFNCIKQEK